MRIRGFGCDETQLFSFSWMHVWWPARPARVQRCACARDV